MSDALALPLDAAVNQPINPTKTTYTPMKQNYPSTAFAAPISSLALLAAWLETTTRLWGVILLIAAFSQVFGQKVLGQQHRIGEILANADHTVLLSLDGVVSQPFVPFYDLYPLEASSNLVDWSPLAMLQRTNNSADALNYRDRDATDAGQRFYRTPTNFFITPFPKPSGPYAVGTVSRLMTDPSRIRKTKPTNSSFMVTFWYPAEARAGVLPDAYVDRRITLVHDGDGNPSYWNTPSTVAKFVSHALPGLPLATNQTSYPVLIYSHGHDGHRRQNTALAEELASHGYVVVAMDHHDAFASVFPDGQVVLTLPLNCPIFETSYSSFVEDRIKDCRFVVDELSRLDTNDALLGGRLDLKRLGAVGLSYGGTTVAELGRIDPRFRAVVLLDAGVSLDQATNLTQFGLQKPFLSMSSTMDRPECPGWSSDWLGSSLALFAKATHDAFCCQIEGSTHASFGDKGSLINDPSRTGNPTTASRAQGQTIRACTLSFFNKYLNGQDDRLLDDPAAVYPNIINFQGK